MDKKSSRVDIMNDLTVVYYTANAIPEGFAEKTQEILFVASAEHPIVSVSQKPINFGLNIVVDLPRSHLSIYQQALIGAKAARTEYIALCEDDVLYSSKHFKYRPTEGKFAYNLGYWSLFTWSPKVFSYKGRKNLCNLICNRKLFIEAIEERFAAYPDGKVNLGLWAEPGKYERQLGVIVRETEEFYTDPPNIMFSHETALSFDNLGTRKRMGPLKAIDIPYWGRAEEIASFYA